jgi:hypothetical protein
MTRKLVYGAIVLVSAIGVAFPAFAANYDYSAGSSGGGNPGYNKMLTYPYRLKGHHASRHTSSGPQVQTHSQ